MQLRLLVMLLTLLLWNCRVMIWLMTKVRSRMAAAHLVYAQGEIEATIQNVRMWIKNDGY